MLSVAHGVTGALIFSQIPNPLIAVPLTLAAHYAQDYVPHWDVGTGISSGRKSKRQAFLQELFIDFPASLFLVYLIFQYRQTFSPYPYLGWFTAILPDFLEFPYLFLGWRFFPLKQLARAHAFVHRSTPKIVWGTLPQVVTILAAFLLHNHL